MQLRTSVMPVIRTFNSGVVALSGSPRLGRYVRRHIAVITYVGRRSGREFSTPVGYRREGDEVTIRVLLPEAKTWWRNFRGEGRPLSLDLDGETRTGHAIAHQDERGRVTVQVRLDKP